MNIILNKELVSSTSAWWVVSQHVLLSGILFSVPFMNVYGLMLAWMGGESHLLSDQLIVSSAFLGSALIAPLITTFIMKGKIRKVGVMKFLQCAKIFSITLSIPLCLIILELVLGIAGVDMTYISGLAMWSGPIVYYFVTRWFCRREIA